MGQEERMRRLELDMLGRMEQMMLAMQQQQQQNQFQQLRAGNGMGGGNPMSADLHQSAQNLQNGMSSMKSLGELDPLPYGARGASVSTLSGLAHLMGNQASMGMKNGVSNASGGIPGGPTLPPHPKQKQLPTQGLPGSMSLPPGRMDSLRNISALSRGISSISRGLSTESQGGINAFEDKFFSMLMNGENKNQFVGNGLHGNFNPTPMSAASNTNGTNNITAMNGNNVMNSSSNNKETVAEG